MLCRVIVPMEYGVTTEEKIDVGVQIITPLLKKMHRDILWWRDNGMKDRNPSRTVNNKEEDKEEHEWDKSGLDEAAIN